MKKTILFAVLLSALFANGQSLTSSNLPIIVLNTNGQTIPDDPKITATMGIVDNGPGMRNNLTDSFNVYNGNIGIEVRGQSSQMFPMKSYGIELRNAAGKSINQSLFGMPEESDWVMYAPYTDKTLMRNFLAYTFSQNTGQWSAHCRYAEVVLNGQYIGIYVFMEKIKRGSGRVDVTKMKATDNTGDPVTGGYIFSIDKEANGWFSSYKPPYSPNASIQYSYVYPKPEDISQEQMNYIKSYVDSFENALAGPDLSDSVKGFRAFADQKSFIDYLIVNEISRNVDGYRLSSYFYKDRDSRNTKIHAGPVWDYDLAFRNANYCNGSNTSGWGYDFNSVCTGDFWQIPFWWQQFMKDSSFRSELLCRWTDLRKSVLSNTQIDFWIDSIADLTSEARTRHFAQWPILGTYIWPNPDPIPATYDGEISTLKSWIQQRLAWIDANLYPIGPCAPPKTDTSTYTVRIWPNPSSAWITLSIKSTLPQTASFTIVSVLGKKVYEGSINLPTGITDIPVNISAWSDGVYFARIYLGNGTHYTVKLLKR